MEAVKGHHQADHKAQSQQLASIQTLISNLPIPCISSRLVPYTNLTFLTMSFSKIKKFLSKVTDSFENFDDAIATASKNSSNPTADAIQANQAGSSKARRRVKPTNPIYPTKEHEENATMLLPKSCKHVSLMDDDEAIEAFEEGHADFQSRDWDVSHATQGGLTAGSWGVNARGRALGWDPAKEINYHAGKKPSLKIMVAVCGSDTYRKIALRTCLNIPYMDHRFLFDNIRTFIRFLSTMGCDGIRSLLFAKNIRVAPVFFSRQYNNGNAIELAWIRRWGAELRTQMKGQAVGYTDLSVDIWPLWWSIEAMRHFIDDLEVLEGMKQTAYCSITMRDSGHASGGLKTIPVEEEVESEGTVDATAPRISVLDLRDEFVGLADTLEEHTPAAPPGDPAHSITNSESSEPSSAFMSNDRSVPSKVADMKEWARRGIASHTARSWDLDICFQHAGEDVKAAEEKEYLGTWLFADESVAAVEFDEFATVTVAEE